MKIRFKNALLISILLLLFNGLALSQIRSAIVGINGLTCSACSFATEKSIRKLDFVDSVSMQLEKSLATVYFKKDSKPDLDRLAQKVIDAGFSVRQLLAITDVGTVKISNDLCLLIGNDYFHFINISAETELKGLQILKIVGEKFMTPKEFRSWKMLCKNNCGNPPASDVLFSKTYYATLP